MLSTMKLSQLTSSDLARLTKLITEKDMVFAKLRKIEAEIDSFDTGALIATGATGKKRGRPAGQAKGAKLAIPLEAKVKKESTGAKRGPKKGQKPGAFKAALVAALTEAGTAGLTISEIAAKLGTKSNNVYSWFYTTGKKTGGFNKSDEGKYTLAA
jgi:hypothetical protein